MTSNDDDGAAVGLLSFAVIEVTHPVLCYEPARNRDADNNSDGTTNRSS